MTTATSAEERLYLERAAKAERWRELGFNPFGNGFVPDALAGDLHARFDNSASDVLAADRPGPFSLGGRVVGLRDFGKAAFLVLEDRTGTLQVHVKRDVLGETPYEAFKAVDVSDFVGVRGHLFKSKTGELTLAAQAFVPITKALRALPGKFSKGDDAEAKAWAERQALADVEDRYRRRYVDMLSNPSVRDTFRKRSRLIQCVRRFFDARDYLEVETPMMHALASGATARPFRTHHNALDLDLCLRIAPELYLKRLVVGGFHRVYEINRSFRNEGLSTRHNPEFTMLEFYQAFATYEDLMALTEELLAEVAMEVCGSAQVRFGRDLLDFSGPFRRIAMRDAVRECVPALAKSDLSDCAEIMAAAMTGKPAAGHANIEKMNAGQLLALNFELHVEPTLIQPTFVTEFPIEISPLARRSDKNPRIADRFELFCAGREIANAFSELNDPVDQEARFRAQLEAKAAGDGEAMDFDADYIRALEHGLPPTAGEGIGIDRLAMLLTDQQSIREVILFPLLKPRAVEGDEKQSPEHAAE